ncbi:uncharacterized protein LOC133195051 [Saccostrea echinata]|uniref:uncharacterized protein LOC133195051 n=1 Tax=Saccostrea echinata TaxID=191078 RepID=UPI002A821664|nr:uncharacterized protein LOC133195051 [Saccostrea echinata]
MSVFCEVDSSSFTNMSIRNQNTSEILSIGTFTNTLNFTEKSARCFHTALYICTAENRIGFAASDPIQIYVNCGPRSLDGLYFLRIPASFHDKLEMSANFLSYPTPSFQWGFRQKSTSPELTLSSDFIRTSTIINISSFSVHLKKTVLEEDQFGYYTVRVTNDYGSFMTTFHIIPQGNSDSQQNVCKSSSTELSALIPILASVSTVMFIFCAGLIIFIILRRRFIKKGKHFRNMP